MKNHGSITQHKEIHRALIIQSIKWRYMKYLIKDYEQYLEKSQLEDYKGRNLNKIWQI